MTIVNFSDLFKGGYQTWRKNFVLCIPFLLGMLLSSVAAVLIMFPIVLSILLPFFRQMMIHPEAMGKTEVMQQILQLLSDNFISILAMGIITVLICYLIISFFTAGAIGMAKEAVISGKTNISHMLRYGKRKYMSLFGVNIFIVLIMLVGFLALLPGLISIFSHIQSSPLEAPDQEYISGTLSLVVGYLFAVPYWLIFSIILTLVPYAVVLDDVPAVKGFKRGIKVFFQHNILNVFVTWLIIMLIIGGFSLVAFIPYIGFLIMCIFYCFVVMPLMTVWWVKLYIMITKDDLFYTQASHGSGEQL